MKVLITGGHLAPALAVIDEMTSGKNNYQIEVIFAGRQHNSDNELSYSLEYKEINRRNIKFIALNTGRLVREISLRSLKNFLLIIIGFINGLKIIHQVRPDAVVSFGGYLGFPFVFWGWLTRIPVYIHEQTLNPGLANRVGSYLAKKVFVSFPSTSSFFQKNKVINAGNPVRKDVFKIYKKPFDIDKKLPVIYVTGGSLGSHSLNIHLAKILRKLLTDFIVIHQSGNVKEYNDYQMLSELRQSLPIEMKKRYFLREHIFSDEIGYIFSVSDFVVGRSGANTFFELIDLKKPAILIPLPWSANQEQQKQAELFLSQGLGEIFSQFDSSEKLYLLIKQVAKNINQYKACFNQLKPEYKQNAAEIIIQTILH